MKQAQRLLLLLLLHTCLLAAISAEEVPEYAWFEKHLSTKCFAAPDATWRLDDGSKETVMHRETRFYGVKAQQEGFFYYYSTTTKQTEYAVSGNSRTIIGEGITNTVLHRCQYGVRRSTQAVHGMCYPSTGTGVPNPPSSGQPWPFVVHVASLKLLSDSIMHQTLDTMPPYEDMYAATPSGVKPGRQEALIMYKLDPATGKASVRTQISVFNVDPVTLKREFIGSQEPKVEEEVPCRHTPFALQI